MANLAAVFHWTPRDMDSMELSELMDWHDQALERLAAIWRGGVE